MKRNPRRLRVRWQHDEKRQRNGPHRGSLEFLLRPNRVLVSPSRFVTHSVCFLFSNSHAISHARFLAFSAAHCTMALFHRYILISASFAISIGRKVRQLLYSLVCYVIYYTNFIFNSFTFMYKNTMNRIIEKSFISFFLRFSISIKDIFARYLGLKHDVRMGEEDEDQTK